MFYWIHVLYLLGWSNLQDNINYFLIFGLRGLFLIFWNGGSSSHDCVGWSASEVRQTGHVGLRRSHGSTQWRWKECAHQESTRSSSPPPYSPRHTAQLLSAAAAVPYTTLGSALIAASSSPPAAASTITTTPPPPAAAPPPAVSRRRRVLATAAAAGTPLRAHMWSMTAMATMAPTLTTMKTMVITSISPATSERADQLTNQDSGDG